MKHRTRITQFAAVAAIVAGTAGVAAAQGQAAPSAEAPAAQARRPEDRGHRWERENRAPPQGRSARHPPDRLR